MRERSIDSDMHVIQEVTCEMHVMSEMHVICEMNVTYPGIRSRGRGLDT